MPNSKTLAEEIRYLLIEGNLEGSASLLTQFQLNDFNLLAGRVNTFKRDYINGVLSKSEEYVERNRLAQSITKALEFFEEKKHESSMISFSHQQNGYESRITDAFIHNFEKQLNMNSQTQFDGERRPKIKAYYYLEDQILNYTSFIKVIETLESHHAQYGTEMPKLIQRLNAEIKQLGELLDSSGNSNSEIRQEVKLVHEFSERIRAKLLNAISNRNPIQVYKTIDGNEKLQLRITLNRLIALLQSKMKKAEGFSMN